MAIRKIATIGHPVLRQKARIAANQVYEPIQVCAIWVKDNPRYPYKPNVPLTVLVNPRIDLLTDDSFVNYEGCLSVPNLRGEVKRVTRIRVRAWDREGSEIDREVMGLTAGTFQHELDHLEGTLFVDRVFDTKSLCTWQEFERYHLAGFAERARAIVSKYGS
jgi:peptide deformylase